MTKITEAQLIESLKQLKEIKPNKQWASLLKSTLLENKVPSRMTGAASAQSVSFMDTVKFIFSPKKLAYSFAAVLILIIGVFGLVKLLPQGQANKQTASLTEPASASLGGQLLPSQNVVALTNDIKATVSALAKNLKANPTQDPKTLKAIATSLKTLADVQGTDLTATSDVQNLYQTVVQSQIADLQKTTLTDAQKSILTQAENLYNQGKYADALELLMTSN